MKSIVGLTLCLLFVVIGSGHEAAAEANASGCVAPSFTYNSTSTIESCTKLLKDKKLSNSERARILTLRGRSLKVDKQLDAAIRDFDFALALKPDDPTTLEMRAWAAIDANDLKTASKIVDQLLSANADNATAYNIAGTLASVKHNDGAALRYYDKAIGLRPDDILARFNRLILYKLNGYNRGVVSEADALLALDTPDLDTLYATLENKRMSFRTQARLERALAWESMGKTKETEKAFADWIAVEPSAVSYGYRAAFYLHQERYQQALADLDKALADDPTFWLLSYTQGNVYLYTNRNDDAIRSFTRAIELNPTSGASFWLRAMAERRLHRDKPALHDALTGVAVDNRFRIGKIVNLAQLGYLQFGPNEANNPMPALDDAVKACMLDEKCW